MAGRGRHGYLLSGLVTCADCGNSMAGVYARWGAKKDRRYTCRKNFQGAKKEGCRPVKAVPASMVEKAVWEKVRAWLQDPAALAWEAANISARTGDHLADRLGVMQKHLADVEKGQSAILDALASGLMELGDEIKNI